MTLKNFINAITNSNRIYTRDDIGNMSGDEFRQHEKAIDYQLKNIGVPRNADLADSSDVVFVHSYTRDDGTEVKSHYRSKPDGITTGHAANVNYNETVNPVSNAIYSKKQNFDGTVKKPMTKTEKLIDFSAKTFGVALPLAHANLQNSMRDFSEAKKNENVLIIYDRRSLKNPEINRAIDSAGIPKNARGTVYGFADKNSEQLAESKQIYDFINQNYEKLKSNSFHTADIHFYPYASNDVKEIIKSVDNYLGIQHATLYKPHIDSDGYFNAIVLDLYDFEHRKGIRPDVLINNWGHSMQEKNRLEKQFNLYYIRKKVK